jgi:hypothetical protein
MTTRKPARKNAAKATVRMGRGRFVVEEQATLADVKADALVEAKAVARKVAEADAEALYRELQYEHGRSTIRVDSNIPKLKDVLWDSAVEAAATSDFRHPTVEFVVR